MARRVLEGRYVTGILDHGRQRTSIQVSPRDSSPKARERVATIEALLQTFPGYQSANTRDMGAGGIWYWYEPAVGASRMKQLEREIMTGGAEPPGRYALVHAGTFDDIRAKKGALEDLSMEGPFPTFAQAHEFAASEAGSTQYIVDIGARAAAATASKGSNRVDAPDRFFWIEPGGHKVVMAGTPIARYNWPSMKWTALTPEGKRLIHELKN
jgi:hypothetical protein